MDDLFEQLKERRSIVDITYEILQERIINGELPVDIRINQVELAKNLNVSRTVVREALRRLEAKNMIKFTPNHSAVIEPITSDDLHDIMRVRETMETLAIRKAVPNMTTDLLQTLAELLDQLSQETDSKKWLKADRIWHMTLYEASHNHWLCDMILDTRINIQRYTQNVKNGLLPRFGAAVKEHKLILNAVKDGNESLAQEELRKHIKQTERLLVKRLTKKS